MFGANFGSSLTSNNGDVSRGQPGRELAFIETDHLALQAAEITSGDRLKLFAEPWPTDKQPPPSASLLSIASQKGLIAAAGPNSLVVSSTDKLRAAYISRRRKKNDSNGLAEDEQSIKLHIADATLSIPRVSHVAFNSDESCLVIAAEEGGGLAVYDTNAVTSGGQEPAFQLSTNGASVRHLIPNPSADPSLAYFFGVVLSNGQLVLADLKERKLVTSTSGSPVFSENVVCAAWSKLGKQIVAGLEDGSAVQLDRQGAVKARIPRPPQLDEIKQSNYESARALPLCSISWLSNYEFLLIYSPFNPPAGDDMPPTNDSVYFLAQGDKDKPFTYHRFMEDPCAAFVAERTPAHHFIARLSDWAPGMADALVVASSAAIDIGLFIRPDKAGAFGTALLKDEGRRAALPLSYVDQCSDTTPVGVAFDFSARELAPRPIPAESDVVPDSRVPLPALCVLNSEGVLSIWWVVYDDAIRQSLPYPAMTQRAGPYRTYDQYAQENNGFSDGNSSAQQPPSTSTGLQPQTASTTTSLFGSSSSGGSTAPPASSQPAFGKSSFGAAPSTPAAFGASSLGLNKQASVWGAPGSASSPSAATPAFGKSSFGASAATATPTPAAPAFGQSSFGVPSTPGAAPAFGKPSAPTFGAPAFGSATPVGGASTGAFGTPSAFGAAAKASPWGSSGGQQSGAAATSSPFAAAANGKSQSNGFASFASGAQAQSGGFASFASGNASSPFAAAAGQNNNTGSGANVFGSASSLGQSSPFASAANKSSPFASAAAQPNSSSPFASAAPQSDNKSSPFGSGAPLGSSSTLFGGAATPAKQENNSTTSPFAQPKKPDLTKEASMGSTATLGGSSAGSSFSFVQPSGSGSSFFGKPSGLVKEESMGEESASKPKENVPPAPSKGTFGLPSGGFKLGSTFQGDGSAKDDLPKPANPGAGFFGGGFGNSLQGTAATPAPSNQSPFSFAKKEATTTEKSAPASSPFSFIKKEPGTESEPKLKDIPEAPKSKVVDDAPLPPDPMTYKAPKMPDDIPPLPAAKAVPEDAPLPPDPSTVKKTAPLPTDLPAPPAPTEATTAKPLFGGVSKPLFGSSKPLFGEITQKKAEEKETPIVGSPPVDLGRERVPPALPDGDDENDESEPDWEDETGDEDGEDDGDEDEGEEEDEDEVQDEDDGEEDEDEGTEEEEEDEEEQLPKVLPPDRAAALNAFKNRMTPASPKQDVQEDESTTPQSSFKKMSYTPAGMPRTLPKGPTFAPPAQRPQLSPRSPSPVRAVTSPVGRHTFVPEPMHSQMTASVIAPAKPVERKRAPSKPKQFDASQLADEEDDRIKAILATPAEPITTLHSFLTHKEYSDGSTKPGIPGQIEKVYRDVNAMIDVAGLNARQIAAFVDGHTTLRHPGDRTVDDVEDDADWVFADLQDIPKILAALDQQLTDGMLQKPRQIVADVGAHHLDLLKLRTKTTELRKTIGVHNDPQRVAAQEAAPLSAETQAQQSELRERMTAVQKLLAEAEESMALLRADLASASAQISEAGSTAAAAADKVPTVEAVMNTILKMTAMVEQRSGDVDVLEAQIRRLPHGLAALSLGDSSAEDALVRQMRSSRFTAHAHSPSATPPRRARIAPNGDALGMSGMFGLSGSVSRYQTPPSASVLGRSALMSPETARKKMVDVTAEEVQDWARKSGRRKLVLQDLKGKVLKRGATVVKAG